MADKARYFLDYPTDTAGRIGYVFGNVMAVALFLFFAIGYLRY